MQIFQPFISEINSDIYSLTKVILFIYGVFKILFFIVSLIGVGSGVGVWKKKCQLNL